ncbi:MAG: glucokinase [Micavibrio sp.]|nr:glucokinase [Micavibrio sp.]
MIADMKILCDIGGTFCRFALVEDSVPTRIRKYEAAHYPTFLDALSLYCDEESIPNSGDLYLAVAGSNIDGVWKFGNKNTWLIDAREIKKAGWNPALIVNDFEANVWSLLALKDGELNVLREGRAPWPTKCLTGPGTGLGLGYLHYNNGTPFVQPTHGGQMPAAFLTDEQWQIGQIVSRIKERDNALTFEDFVSGYGLLHLYQAACIKDGAPAEMERVRDLPDHLESAQVKCALRLLHEFFGQFAASAVISGHAYGGLYIAGGVIERLVENNIFDVPTFERAFNIKSIEAVAHDLAETPIIHILDSTPALKGLIKAGGL